MLKIHAHTITQAMFNLLKDNLEIELQIRDANDPEHILASYEAYLVYDEKQDSIVPMLSKTLKIRVSDFDRKAQLIDLFLTWKICLENKCCITLTSYREECIRIKKGDVFELY